MKKFILLIIILSSYKSFSQWSYKTVKSDFDGVYRKATTIGSGDEYPYKNPYLTIKYNKKDGLDIYISGAGYSACDNREAIFKFNNDDVLYKSKYINEGSNNDSWFITSLENITEFELIEKFSKHNYFSVRLRNDCGIKDYRFSLKGSTKAIKYVIPKELLNSEFERIKLKRKINLQEATKAEKKKRLRNNEINRLLDSIKSVKFDKTSIERIYLTIERDITKGLNNIKSIKVKPRYDTKKGRWVDVFYLLNDDTEKKIFGYHRVESNSPIMIQAKRLEDIRNADRILKEKIKDSLAKLESNSKKTNSPIPIKKVIKVKTEKIYIITTSNGKIIKSKGYRVNNKKRITDIQRVDGTFVRLRTSKIISINQNGKELLRN